MHITKLLVTQGKSIFHDAWALHSFCLLSAGKRQNDHYPLWNHWRDVRRRAFLQGEGYAMSGVTTRASLHSLWHGLVTKVIGTTIALATRPRCQIFHRSHKWSFFQSHFAPCSVEICADLTTFVALHISEPIRFQGRLLNEGPFHFYGGLYGHPCSFVPA